MLACSWPGEPIRPLCSSCRPCALRQWFSRSVNSGSLSLSLSKLSAPQLKSQLSASQVMGGENTNAFSSHPLRERERERERKERAREYIVFFFHLHSQLVLLGQSLFDKGDTGCYLSVGVAAALTYTYPTSMYTQLKVKV